ncbi:hypothetical protein MHYP_G00104460 [Metynnis hypsauchen]
MTMAIAGETVTIRCPYPEQFETNDKYFYKWDGHYFAEVIHITESHRERFSISDDRRSKVLSVRIRDVSGDDGGVYFCAVWTGGDPAPPPPAEDQEQLPQNLSLQDAGSYRCGEAGVWNHTVNLEVKTDPCCLGSNTVSGYLGETVTISCSYPEEFKSNSQYLLKQDGEGFTEVNQTKDSQRGRFSSSDDRRSKVLSVRISDVREDDGGVYYCGSWTGGGQWFSSYSLYTEIQLQVTGEIQ